MSSKSKETINIVELVGIGYSFTDIMYRAQKAAGEYIIFYSLTETQRNSLHFLDWLSVETTVTVLCNTVCIPVTIRFQVSNAFVSAVEKKITLRGRTSTQYLDL